MTKPSLSLSGTAEECAEAIVAAFRSLPMVEIKDGLVRYYHDRYYKDLYWNVRSWGTFDHILINNFAIRLDGREFGTIPRTYTKAAWHLFKQGVSL
jgi:hypothetical protein